MTPGRARIQQLIWLVFTLLTLVSVRSAPEVGKGDQCNRSAENATIVRREWLLVDSQCPSGCCQCDRCKASSLDYDGEVWARCGSSEWCSRTCEAGAKVAGATMWCDLPPIEVLSNGDASCSVRSDCMLIQTADACFKAARAQGIGTSGYTQAFGRASSQPGCFLYRDYKVQFNTDFSSTEGWDDIAPICWCTLSPPPNRTLNCFETGDCVFLIVFGLTFCGCVMPCIPDCVRDRRIIRDKLWRAVAALTANERAGTGTDQARREHQHVSEPDIGAAAPSSSTQRHAEVDGVPALEPQVTGDSDSSPPAFQAQTVITGVPVSGTPMCTMVTVAGRVAPRLTLAQAGSPLTLADKVEALNTELGLTFTAVSKQAVEAIAAILGMADAIKGKPLIEQVNTCYAAAFSTARDITAHAGPTVSDPSTVGSSDPRP